MKILKQVDYSNWAYKITCSECDTQFEVDYNDISYQHYPGDCREPSSEQFSVSCPVCHNVRNLPKNDIPKALQIKIKGKSSSHYNSLYYR